jgi:hypothetical protein
MRGADLPPHSATAARDPRRATRAAGPAYTRSIERTAAAPYGLPDDAT